jgi:hypothetical protein
MIWPTIMSVDDRASWRLWDVLLEPTRPDMLVRYRTAPAECALLRHGPHPITNGGREQGKAAGERRPLALLPWRCNGWQERHGRGEESTQGRAYAGDIDGAQNRPTTQGKRALSLAEGRPQHRALVEASAPGGLAQDNGRAVGSQSWRRCCASLLRLRLYSERPRCN